MNLNNVKIHTFPFGHCEFSHFFEDNELQDISNLDIFDEFGNELSKTRTSSKKRHFVNNDLCKRYPILNKTKNFFASKDTIELIESFHKLVGTAEKGNSFSPKSFPQYLRIEIIKDVGESWLEPHCDIIEKYMSMLIFLNDCDESHEIGTDLYVDTSTGKKLVKTVPFINNTGYFFYPSDNTWHGLEKKKIKQHRKIIMVNYVSFETEIRL